MSTRTVMVRIRGDVSDLNRALMTGGRNVKEFSRELETSNDRATWLVQGLAAVVPAIVPIAAQGVPVIAGLANILGFATAAAGSALLAFNGMGGALKAFNDYQAEPSVANLQKLNEAMDKLGPSGREFVRHLDEILPQLKDLKVAAEDGLMPGATDGLDDLITVLPRVRSLIAQVSTASGMNLAELGDNLADPRWTEFFDFLDRQAGPTVAEFGRTLGNLTEGWAQLWMAFEPTEQGFSEGLLNMSRDFKDWATGLDDTEGFEEFLNYLDTTGPQVLDTVGELVDMILEVGEAAAPLGGPALAGIRLLAETIATIADSPLGPVIIGATSAVMALSRALAVQELLVKRTSAESTGMFGRMATGYKSQLGYVKTLSRDTRTALQFGAMNRAEMEKQVVAASRARGAIAGIAKTGAGVAGLALATTGLADGMGFSNTASLALAGTLAGPWGAAIGGSIGLLMDFKAGAKDTNTVIGDLDRAMGKSDFSKILKNYRDLKGIQKDIASTSGVGDFFGDIPKSGGASLLNWAGDITSSELPKAKKQLEELRPAYMDLAEAIGRPLPKGTTLDQIAKVADRLAPALRELGVSADDVAKMDPGELAAFADELKVVLAASDSTAGRTKALGKAITGLDDDLLNTSSSAAAFAAALDSVIGPGLSAEEATDQYTKTVRDLGKALKDNGGGFEGNTKAALANRAATRQWMGDFTGMLTKQAEAGASSGKIARQIDGARAAFIREATAAGLSAGQIRRRLRVMGLTPKLIRTVFNAAGLEQVSARVRRLNTQYQRLPKRIRVAIRSDGVPKTEGDLNRLDKKVGGLTRRQRRIIARLMDQTGPTQQKILRNLKKIDQKKTNAKIGIKDEATGKLHGIQRTIDALHGKDVTVTTHQKTVKDNALGGFYVHDRTSSAGDYKDAHRPEIAAKGVMRVWNEDETEGESYIPHANDYRRPGARAILEQTAAVLGAREVVWNAEGAFAPRHGDWSAPGARGSVTVSGPSLKGLRIEGTMNTPFGPAQVRGVVREEIADADDMAGMRGRARG